jgi:DNA-binding NarL/FixJ family response regulator
MKKLRVLIADDHPLFRAGLGAMLASAPDTELVGEATTGSEAVSLAAELGPDLVIMDVQMPRTDGIEATRRISRENPETNILVVTMFGDDGTVFQAMRAGAKGYILKGANYAEMLRDPGRGQRRGHFQPADSRPARELLRRDPPGHPAPGIP